MKIRSRSAAAIAAVALGAGLMLTATPAHAAACPIGFDCQTTWYSDPEMTQPVGGEWTNCDGVSGSWGVRGGYMKDSRIPC